MPQDKNDVAMISNGLGTYKSYSVVVTEAVKDSYLINLVQSIGDDSCFDDYECGNVLFRYATGDIDYDKAVRLLEGYYAEEITIITGRTPDPTANAQLGAEMFKTNEILADIPFVTFDYAAPIKKDETK